MRWSANPLICLEMEMFAGPIQGDKMFTLQRIVIFLSNWAKSNNIHPHTRKGAP
jgi:hypothetical protein